MTDIEIIMATVLGIAGIPYILTIIIEEIINYYIYNG